MANLELAAAVDQQINEIMGRSFPEMDRFYTCQALLTETKNVLGAIPDFRRALVDSYFSSRPFCTTFSLGRNKFTVTYNNGINVGEEEVLDIVRNDEERLNIHTYIYPNGRVNGFLFYYEDPPAFKVLKYGGDLEQSKAEAQRIIKELRLGSM